MANDPTNDVRDISKTSARTPISVVLAVASSAFLFLLAVLAAEVQGVASHFVQQTTGVSGEPLFSINISLIVATTCLPLVAFGVAFAKRWLLDRYLAWLLLTLLVGGSVAAFAAFQAWSYWSEHVPKTSVAP